MLLTFVYTNEDGSKPIPHGVELIMPEDRPLLEAYLEVKASEK